MYGKHKSVMDELKLYKDENNSVAENIHAHRERVCTYILSFKNRIVKISRRKMT